MPGDPCWVTIPSSKGELGVDETQMKSHGNQRIENGKGRGRMTYNKPTWKENPKIYTPQVGINPIIGTSTIRSQRVCDS